MDIGNYLILLLLLVSGALIGCLTNYITPWLDMRFGNHTKEEKNKLYIGDKEISPKELAEITNRMTIEKGLMVEQFYRLNLCIHCEHYNIPQNKCCKNIEKYSESGKEKFCEMWKFSIDHLRTIL